MNVKRFVKKLFEVLVKADVVIMSGIYHSCHFLVEKLLHDKHKFSAFGGQVVQFEVMM